MAGVLHRRGSWQNACSRGGKSLRTVVQKIPPRAASGAGFKGITNSLFVHCLFTQNGGFEPLTGVPEPRMVVKRPGAGLSDVLEEQRKAGGTAFLVPAQKSPNLIQAIFWGRGCSLNTTSS